jgi:hypothetical protein
MNPEFDPLENVFNFTVENDCHRLHTRRDASKRLHIIAAV